MKVETCGNCGCKFSWDNTALFGGSPTMEWLSYLCPDCAREKAEQARHDEREREEERRHRERMDADAERQDAPIRAAEEISRSVEAAVNRANALSRWRQTPLFKPYEDWYNSLDESARSKAAHPCDEGTWAFYDYFKGRISNRPINEQLNIFIKNNEKVRRGDFVHKKWWDDGSGWKFFLAGFGWIIFPTIGGQLLGFIGVAMGFGCAYYFCNKGPSISE